MKTLSALSFSFILIICLRDIQGNDKYSKSGRSSIYKETCKGVKISTNDGYKNFPYFIKMYDWMLSQDKLEKLANGEFDSTQYILTFLPIIITLAVLCLIVIFLGVICGMYDFYDKIFCWKFKPKLYTSSNILCIALIYYILCVILLGTGCTAIYFLVKFHEGLSQVKCMVSKVDYVLLNGEEGREWGGVYSINNKTDNITKALSDERPNFGVLAENYDKGLLNIGEIPMKTLKEMVATLSEMNVINPDPNQIIAHPTIIPEYIKYLGPLNLSNSNSNLLKKDADERMNIVLDAMNTIYIQANYVNDSNVNIIQKLEEDEEKLMNFQINIHSILNTAYDYLFTNWLTAIMILLFIYISLMLITSAVVLILLIIAQINKSNIKWRKYYHLSWITSGAYVVFGLLLLIFLIPYGLTIIDSCELLDQYTTPEGLVSHPKLLDPTSGTLLNACLNGDGGLGREIGLENDTRFGSLIYEAVNIISDKKEIIENPRFPKVEKQIQRIKEISRNPAIAVSNCPFVFLHLIKWTDNNTQGAEAALKTCNPSPQDFWCFVKESCPHNYKYEENFADYYDDFSFRQCLLIDNMAKENYWGEIYWKLRYRELNCANTDQELIIMETDKYIQQLYNFGKEVKEKFLNNPGVIKYIYKFKEEMILNIQQMNQNMNSIQIFEANTKECISAIADVNIGLLSSLNCSFIQEYYNLGNIGMCGYLGPGISMVVLSITIIVIFGTLAAFLGILLVQRNKILDLEEYEALELAIN